ncbi:hypothetical protein [Flagellimonas sp. 2504JD4-2]
MSETILGVLVNSKQVSLELYWKDKTLFNLEITQDISSENQQDITFEVLDKISKISTSWSVDLPENFDMEDFDFSGISNGNFKWDYVSWASFILQKKDVTVLDIT